MNAPVSGSRSCPKCGGVNYGTLSNCILCSAPMTADASDTRSPKRFCGDCGSQLEDGVTFCGECGASVASSPISREMKSAGPPPPMPKSPPVVESASRWAPPNLKREPITPPPASPASTVTGTSKRFCKQCGAELKPGTRFCRKCGRDTRASGPVTSQRKDPVKKPVPPRVQTAPAPKPASTPTPPTRSSGVLKKTLRIVVPIGSMVATYFLTNKVFGPMIAQQFGDAGRQMVPMIVSMAVGGVARQITK